ncbi:MAG: adenylyl-sulfate kinase [Verrucomicrobiota bacterium]
MTPPSELPPAGIRRGAVVWLTGLPSAGKSTLAARLVELLRRWQVHAVALDGDVLRAGLCSDLGFSESDRRENVRRAGEIALLLAGAGTVAVGALISPFRSDRERIAATCKERGIPFAEVYVNAPLAVCERRDVKQRYRLARAGRLTAFTGIDSPYEPPLAPALELKTDLEPVEESARKLAMLALALAGGANFT